MANQDFDPEDDYIDPDEGLIEEDDGIYEEDVLLPDEEEARYQDFDEEDLDQQDIA